MIAFNKSLFLFSALLVLGTSCNPKAVPPDSESDENSLVAMDKKNEYRMWMNMKNIGGTPQVCWYHMERPKGQVKDSDYTSEGDKALLMEHPSVHPMHARYMSLEELAAGMQAVIGKDKKACSGKMGGFLGTISGIASKLLPIIAPKSGELGAKVAQGAEALQPVAAACGGAGDYLKVAGELAGTFFPAAAPVTSIVSGLLGGLFNGGKKKAEKKAAEAAEHYDKTKAGIEKIAQDPFAVVKIDTKTRDFLIKSLDKASKMVEAGPACPGAADLRKEISSGAAMMASSEQQPTEAQAPETAVEKPAEQMEKPAEQMEKPAAAGGQMEQPQQMAKPVAAGVPPQEACFTPEAYMKEPANKEVAALIEIGSINSAWHHWYSFGKSEGRKGSGCN
jgi:hypothetical protein